MEDRDPYPNAIRSANWTCVGLCAHASALAGGRIVQLPAFTLGNESAMRFSRSAAASKAAR
jgi:hypothetical protein